MHQVGDQTRVNQSSRYVESLHGNRVYAAEGSNRVYAAEASKL